jgi:hypothetical protein
MPRGEQVVQNPWESADAASIEYHRVLGAQAHHLRNLIALVELRRFALRYLVYSRAGVQGLLRALRKTHPLGRVGYCDVHQAALGPATRSWIGIPRHQFLLLPADEKRIALKVRWQEWTSRSVLSTYSRVDWGRAWRDALRQARLIVHTTVVASVVSTDGVYEFQFQ